MSPTWNQTYSILAGTRGSTATDKFRLNQPHDIFLDGFENLYVTDTYNHRIMKFASGKNVCVLKKN